MAMSYDDYKDKEEFVGDLLAKSDKHNSNGNNKLSNEQVVYMCETILGYLDSGRIDEAKQHLENLQHWFIELPVNGGLSKPKKYAEEFENLLGNPIEQLDKLIDQAKQITEKTKPTQLRSIKRLKYAFNLNSLSINLFGNGDPISIIVSKLDEVIVELNKLIIKNEK